VRITYVLPRPELGGGNKVIFQHVNLLEGAGEEVTVLGDGPRPDWIHLESAYHDLQQGAPRLASQDLVVATYWTTIAVARGLVLGPLAHFCQGYEGGLAHLRPVWPEIEAAYSLPLPGLVVGPHLQDLLRRRFGRESAVAPPPLDPLFRPAPRWGPRRRPWIAVPGIFGADVKDVGTALAAIALLRRQGIAARVLRFSVLSLGDEERRLLAPDRYLCGVRPEEIARVLRRCDLLLLPSREAEGFGLPLLEAMASGVPAVASLIPSTEHLAGDAARLVPAGDPAAFAAAAGELLTHRPAWRRARAAGRQAARRYLPAAVLPRLTGALRWAAAAAAAAEPVRPAVLL
jgi:glycosyltransferase involved in cell wall biosynthesis